MMTTTQSARSTRLAETAGVVGSRCYRWFVGSDADQHGQKRNPAILGLEPAPGLSG